MAENDKIDPDYLKGFNEGYLLAKHMPELTESLKTVKGDGIRLQALHDGRNQYISEQVRDKLPSWLRKDRKELDRTVSDLDKGLSKDKGRSIEPEL